MTIADRPPTFIVRLFPVAADRVRGVVEMVRTGRKDAVRGRMSPGLSRGRWQDAEKRGVPRVSMAVSRALAASTAFMRPISSPVTHTGGGPGQLSLRGLREDRRALLSDRQGRARPVSGGPRP